MQALAQGGVCFHPIEDDVEVVGVGHFVHTDAVAVAFANFSKVSGLAFELGRVFFCKHNVHTHTGVGQMLHGAELLHLVVGEL